MEILIDKNLKINSENNSEETLIKSFNKELNQSKVHGKDLILKALNFAKDIEYSHVGHSRQTYLAHPIRVDLCHLNS